MKKLLPGALLLSLAFFLACQRDNSDPGLLVAEIADSRLKTSVRSDGLPAEILDYVALNCDPFDIEDAWHTPGAGYEVWLGDGQELYFDERGRFIHRRRHDRPERGYGPATGRCMRGDTIQVSGLPAAVNDYIAGQYPGATADIVVDKRGRLFAVELSNGVILLFNRAGTFVRECDGLDAPLRRCMHGREARPALLPPPVRVYLAENYPDAVIQKVVKKWNGLWAVELSDGSVLIFRHDGAFVRLCD